jgi:hypothetical protein
MSLQFNTNHDIEPLGNFVGRCLNNGTKEQDIISLMQKYETRGATLINKIAKKNGIDVKMPQEHFGAIIKLVTNVLRSGCLAKRSSLDIPHGPRDPGYSTPFSVEKLAPY